MIEKDPEEMTEGETHNAIERVLRDAAKRLNQLDRDRRLDARSFFRSLEWMGTFAVCRKCLGYGHRGHQ